MRHFIAMLRDSFREAIDGWIFLVMLIISGILILLVASMSVSPVGVEEAVPKMLPQQPMMMVQPNRGDSKRIGLFNYQVTVSDVKTTAPAEKPWQTGATFTLALTSLGFGGSGVEIEDGKDLKDVKPGDVKQIEGEGLLSDAVKSAVRYWATAPGGPKAEYTDALALEFVKHQVESVSGLRVEKVERIGGGKYRITTTGCEAIRWPHEPTLFFGLWKWGFFQQPLGNLVYIVQSTLVNGLGAWITLLAGVVVTAGFFPNLLRKGAIDLWLTKPVARPLILLYKYLGGLLFVFLLTAVTVGGVWVMIGLRTGVWNAGFLVCVFAITFYFAILYAVSTLLGVLTRNTIVSIVGTLMFWGLLWVIGTVNNAITALDNIDSMRTTAAARQKKDDKKDKKADEDKATTQETEVQPEVRVPPALVTTFHVLNRVTPRTKDLDTLTTLLIGKGIVSEQEERQSRRLVGEIAWAEVIGVSVAYIGLFLGLAMIRFMTRSY